MPNLLKFCPNYLINVFMREKDLNQNTFSKRENFDTNNKSVTFFILMKSQSLIVLSIIYAMKGIINPVF